MPENVIKVKLPQLEQFEGTASGSDQIFLFHTAAGKLKKASVSQLPFNAGGGGGGGTGLAQTAAFKIRNYSTSYQYDEANNQVVITDARLGGKTDYPVSTTQFGGGEFRDDGLEYGVGDNDGKLFIKNFQLDDGEHITIDVNAMANSQYDDLIKKVNQLSAMLAPLIPTPNGPNGAKLLWNRPAIDIPAGWQEWTDIRGKMPIALDPNDNDLKMFGGQGGAKNKKLTVDNLPRIKASIPGATTSQTGNPAGLSFQYKKGTDVSILDIGKDTPDDINLLNPYRIVIWIEFIGLD